MRLRYMISNWSYYPEHPVTARCSLRSRLAPRMEPMMRLGRDYALDGELAERVALIEGIDKVSLTTRRGGSHLRLVA